MSELFRFMVFRPPTVADPSDTKYVQLEDLHSVFRRSLRDILEHEGTPQNIADYAKEFVGSEAYTAGLDRLSIPLARFAPQLVQNPPASLAALEATIENTFGYPVVEVVKRAEFVEDRRRITDSLIALTLLHRERESVYSQLVLGARLCRLVERAAVEDARLVDEEAIARTLEETLILPPDLFPLRAPGGFAAEVSGAFRGRFLSQR